MDWNKADWNDENTAEVIEAHLNMSEEQLFAALAYSTDWKQFKQATGFIAPVWVWPRHDISFGREDESDQRKDITRMAELGRQIWDLITDRIYQAVCVKWEYCKKRDDPRFNTPAAIIIAVTDIIVGLQIGFTPVTAASLIVRLGLDKFCKCDTEKSQSEPASVPL
ncbi:hypothetical protein JW859_06965 [bacterium]|nr:hypothetical protein [bacterium]